MFGGTERIKIRTRPKQWVTMSNVSPCRSQTVTFLRNIVIIFIGIFSRKYGAENCQRRRSLLSLSPFINNTWIERLISNHFITYRCVGTKPSTSFARLAQIPLSLPNSKKHRLRKKFEILIVRRKGEKCKKNCRCGWDWDGKRK